MATPKQRKAAIRLVENGSSDRPKPIGQVLREVGYSEAVATQPQKVTRSEGFLLLMDELGADDRTLATVLQEGLESLTWVKTERVEGQGKTRLKTEEVIAVPDVNTRHKYLETALRLKGLGKTDGGTTVNFNNFVNNQRDKYGL